MATSALHAFHEDVDALQSIAAVERRDHGAPFQEINITRGQAGIATRRLLRQMADRPAAR